MTDRVQAIDMLLAAPLRRDGVAVSSRDLPDAAVMVERIHYHGIAGLLGDRPQALAGWPRAVTAQIRGQALAGAMWELRHRQLLCEVLAAFAQADIGARLLKGTALAYDLYVVPATRLRGDSDLLIAPSDLAAARQLLASLGFGRAPCDAVPAEDHGRQEVWTYHGDGAVAHHIDLHWHLLNAPALEHVLTAAECFADPLPLPTLSPHAFAMSRVAMLAHACIHRAMHFTSPYFVDGREYFGGDRLIWLFDLHLLAEALTSDEWQALCAMADERGLADTCLDGLLTARRFFATRLPDECVARLRAARSRPPVYLGSRQFGRAWEDLKAIPGVRRKLAYTWARVIPPASFIRAKYPRLAGLPLPLLYARRMIDLVRRRPRQGSA